MDVMPPLVRYKEGISLPQDRESPPSPKLRDFGLGGMLQVDLGPRVEGMVTGEGPQARRVWREEQDLLDAGELKEEVVQGVPVARRKRPGRAHVQHR